MVISNLIISLGPLGECNDLKKVYILASLFGAAIAVEANKKRQAVTFILKPEIRNKIIVLSTTEACEFQFVNNLGNRSYSRVHISWNTAFLKILKKPSIVQE